MYCCVHTIPLCLWYGYTLDHWTLFPSMAFIWSLVINQSYYKSLLNMKINIQTTYKILPHTLTLTITWLPLPYVKKWRYNVFTSCSFCSFFSFFFSILWCIFTMCCIFIFHSPAIMCPSNWSSSPTVLNSCKHMRGEKQPVGYAPSHRNVNSVGPGPPQCYITAQHWMPTANVLFCHDINLLTIWSLGS